VIEPVEITEAAPSPSFCDSAQPTSPSFCDSAQPTSPSFCDSAQPRAQNLDRAPAPAAPQPAAAALAAQLGVQLDPEFLVLALTHRSFAHEAGGIPTNERLEFLGDAVLGLVIAEALYRDNPGVPEGQLAKMRAATVSQAPLAAAARRIGLGHYLLLGKGERRTGGQDKDSILSDAIEALIGATYLAHGLETARALVHRLVGEELAAASLPGGAGDWKTELQEAAQALGLGLPEYQLTGFGPDHAKTFEAEVSVGDVTATGGGNSKKQAEQAAAKAAVQKLTELGT